MDESRTGLGNAKTVENSRGESRRNTDDVCRSASTKHRYADSGDVCSS